MSKSALPDLAKVREQLAEYRSRILLMTGRVPPRVVTGDVYLAAKWKIDASRCRELAEGPRLGSLSQLRAAVVVLQQYEDAA